VKLCIVGAGAIGSFIGARIASSGFATVSAVARGETLSALREHGWRLQMGGQLIQSKVAVTDDPAELGLQDVIVIAVKGPALTEIANMIQPLTGPGTMVVPAMNGVPWWFVDQVEGLSSHPLHSVDPNGEIAKCIPAGRVIGAVVHAAVSKKGPGHVVHKMGNKIILGEPWGGKSERVQKLTDLFTQAGFEAVHSANIREEIWYKLWGNMTVNPVSAITGATADKLLADPAVREFCSNAMREASLIGERIGCSIDEDPESRHATTAKLGAFKTSMLQDVEAGLPIELDTLVGVVSELGERLDIATPNINALLGLTRLFGRSHGLYPDSDASGHAITRRSYCP
jgi:2-dehydropantoate 2-reductase